MLKSHRQDYLVGNKLSKADIHLVELLYYEEELDPSLLANFPLLKVRSPMALDWEGGGLGWGWRGRGGGVPTPPTSESVL